MARLTPMLIILRTFRLSSWWGEGREWAMVHTPVGVVCFGCRLFIPGTGPHHYDRSGPMALRYWIASSGYMSPIAQWRSRLGPSFTWLHMVAAKTSATRLAPTPAQGDFSCGMWRAR